MLAFWIISAFLVVIALAIVLPPLVAKGQRADGSRQAMNRAVFDRKLKELDEDLQERPDWQGAVRGSPRRLEAHSD